MESNAALVRELREADRAAAAPYVDYPSTPRWYPPATGLWAGALCLAMTISQHSALRAVALLALVLLEGIFIGWYRRYRGTWPRGRAPQELRRVMVVGFGGAVAVIALGALLVWQAAPWVAALAVFVVVTVLVARYERVYAEAAARARARLG